MITGYIYTLLDVNYNTLVNPTPVTDTSVTLPDLSCGVVYWFVVAGVNSVDVGAYGHYHASTTTTCSCPEGTFRIISITKVKNTLIN